MLYENSNAIEVLPKLNKIKASTKKEFQKLYFENSLNVSEIKKVSDMICKDLGVGVCSIKYDGIQPHSTNSRGTLKNKTLGHYKTIICHITLYKFTAKTKKIASNKSVLDTLLHELCHHFDFVLIGFGGSIHTAGFYKRISSLKNCLIS